MSHGAERASFHPTINRHSRRLTSDVVPLQERQQLDAARREVHRQQLVARVEAEHRRVETFHPATNPRRPAPDRSANSSGSGAGRVAALIPKSPAASQQALEVRRRVQELWRAHAGVGSGEMTRGGVLAALREIGIPAPSAVADKFLLALGLNEEAGVRCVAYDRFSMVVTTVLRAALVPGQCVSLLRGESKGQTAVPTMRRRSAPAAGHKEVGKSHAEIEKKKILEDDTKEEEEEEEEEEEKEEESPSPVALRAGVRRVKRPSGHSLGPSSSSMEQQTHVVRHRQKSPPYDPLAGCTFAPSINKTYRRPKAAAAAAAAASALSQSSKVKPAPPSQEDRELEHCTFAPNTAQFHAQMDSLAWWTREPFTASSAHRDPTPSTDDPSTEGMNRTQTCGPAAAIPLAAGFDKAVHRMIEARRRSRPAFEESLRSGTGEAVARPPLQTVIEPFTLRAEARVLQREQQRPLLYVDVDLPSGRTGRIGVHSGDQPATLAASFAQTYGLGDELRDRLEQVLKEKLFERLRENVPTLWL